MADFFAQARIVPMGVSLVYNSREQPTGEAFVEFGGSDELARAMDLHKQNMGSRYVELFRSTRNEAMQALRVVPSGSYDADSRSGGVSSLLDFCLESFAFES